MKLKNRLLWLLALMVTQALYFPINRIAHGGLNLITPLDRFIPFWPVWAVPYLLSLVWWEGSFIWAALRMESRLYRSFVLGTGAVMLASYVVYLLYPTYVERPLLQDNGWAVELIRVIYSSDRAYNAFPSGHTYNSVLIYLFWSRWQPSRRWLWAGITIIVLLSTLFTGQHNLIDLVGGILLAWAGYRLGLWLTARNTNKLPANSPEEQ